MKQIFSNFELNYVLRDVIRSVPFRYVFSSRKKLENLYIDQNNNVKRGVTAGVTEERSVLSINSIGKKKDQIISIINIGLTLFRLLIHKYPEAKWKYCFVSQTSKYFSFNIAEIDSRTLKYVFENVDEFRNELFEKLNECICNSTCGNCYPLRSKLYNNYLQYLDKQITLDTFF